MKVLNKVGYDPRTPIRLDETHFADPRPPRDAAAVCDYFAWLGFIEDDGVFMHSEMTKLMENPDDFFGKPYAGAP